MKLCILPYTIYSKNLDLLDAKNQHIYIDNDVSSIIEEKFNSEGLVYTLSTETLTEELTQEISQGLKVVEEASYSISVKVSMPEILALLKSKTENISSSVTEEPSNNELKSIEFGPSEKTVQPKISTTVAKLTSPIQSESKTQTSS
ncbi:23608_t:CDS:2 [Dentiscutata erythropus]|uniref:23608_t:CDS:1 n=1 Tax=Dentiscutata erythropus TaxID=1348616 RepID=A0A9N9J4C6_9GLOM|nr:23608_t:CDS:2 [Dentiscutata erythropus]